MYTRRTQPTKEENDEEPEEIRAAANEMDDGYGL
jgi:hypothetical protein